MLTKFRIISVLWLLPVIGLLAACSSTPAPSGLKVGKPYSVNGKVYFPEYDPTYDEIGMASWYGPGFHGKRTASGEEFNQNDLTAAHPTLPMPSIVRVTNLSNGRSLIVRINDRGPFKSNRIIDLSKKAAEKLGMPSTSEVRVQFLKEETEAYLESMPDGKKSLEMLALNAKAKRSRDDSIIRSTEPSGQIVEASDASSHAGQIVTEAAPITSVHSDDLAGSHVSAPVILSSDQPKEVIKQAAAPFSPPKRVEKKEYAQKATARYIQAGSFSSEENAHKFSSKIADVGPTDVSKVETSARTWWRVRVGPFLEAQEAAAALDKLRSSHVPDARIIFQ